MLLPLMRADHRGFNIYMPKNLPQSRRINAIHLHQGIKRVPQVVHPFIRQRKGRVLRKQQPEAALSILGFCACIFCFAYTQPT